MTKRSAIPSHAKSALAALLAALITVALVPAPVVAEDVESAADDVAMISEAPAEDAATLATGGEASLEAGAEDAANKDAAEEAPATEGEAEATPEDEGEAPADSEEEGEGSEDEGSEGEGSEGEDAEDHLSGWVLGEDGVRRYYDPETGELYADGIFEAEGEYYYFRPAGSAFGPEGSVGTGWVRDYGGYDFFFDRSDGHMLRGGIYEVDGYWYYFRPEGNAFGPEGSMGKGWIRDYGDPAADYFFDRTTGRMYRGGAFKVDGKMQLFNEDGELTTGWATIGSHLYYADPATGVCYTGGIYEVDGTKYYFRPAGSSYGPVGSRGTGWVTGYKGQSYFFDRDDGHMLSGGIIEVDGAKYYFRPAGNAFGPEGSLGRGWIRNYGGYDYFFNRSTGKMCRNGIFDADGDRYYFRGAGNAYGPEGSMGKGWLKGYNGANYYFDLSTGKMYRNRVFKLGGTYYAADSTGKVTESRALYPDMLSRAQRYSSPTGWLILVDCTGNRFCIYQGSQGSWAPIKEWRCTTGGPNTPTPRGIFYVKAKGYSFGAGTGHTCYYYTDFYLDNAIHSVLYHEGTFNILDGRLGMNLSQGCIRLAIDNAKYVYLNVPYYSTVVTY